jgi:PKD domain
MRRGIIGTAAVIATALAAPTPALAANWTVSPGASSCNTVDRQCSSLTALAAAGPAAGDDVAVAGGSYSESGANFAVPLTIHGTGPGPSAIQGTIAFNLPVSSSVAALAIRRLIVRASGTGNALVVAAANGSTLTYSASIESSILSGASTGAGLRVSTGTSTFTVNVTARHVTIADSGGAPAISVIAGTGNTPNVSFTDSIVLGANNGASFPDTDRIDAPTDGDRASRFADAPNEDFHLRAHSPDIDTGHGAQGGEVSQDVDGDGRPFGAEWDKGGDEFIEHPPVLSSATATPSSTTVNQPVQFDATGSDPDPGDSVTYSWSFGDGSDPASGQSVSHSYADPGFHTATVTVTDSYHQIDTSNVGVNVTRPPTLAGGGTIGPLPRLGSAASTGPAGDQQPPTVTIRTPRPGQRLRIGRTVPSLRGRAADDSGVRSVELALARRRGATCQWFDGRRTFRSGSCGRPTWFRTVVDDFAWRYSFARGVRPAIGVYSLSVRATDIRGNRTAPTASAARTATFRFVR